ncbi:hypothetical protein Mp_1g29490 [Marchantia polymorpha subsp. ruderalis]|uniref:Uncharacterized protein n=2 Tax=Marchantia polymorpha TaxID=3197 RepID=A0AAF6AVK4_MARPO|nr:hypothetical protein MARPO_1016s0001 [Marchantia polymorpha]BBN00475.1 hypothetical protein Mp_1g29490 [Marchantia polymorpha subsp. ruderalis]|eukprot:PTQ26550.1 hypothetical protein MARPO_1016s0001 [Marchantia polymorpha]
MLGLYYDCQQMIMCAIVLYGDIFSACIRMQSQSEIGYKLLRQTVLEYCIYLIPRCMLALQ